jgi:putative transposase
MPIIKVEVRLSEVRQALEAFRTNRRMALDTISKEIKDLAASTFNQLLNAEIDLFLGNPDQNDNKRNGYLPAREYAIKGVGCVRIKVPKDRKGRFESQVIPAYERIDPRLKADMAMLHLAGLSTRNLALISRRLLGIQVTKDTVSSSLDLIKDEALAWLTRPIDKRYWALYIDGTNFRVQRRGSTESEPSLVVLGIDQNNCRSVLAIEPGTKDNVDAWRAVFSELKKRGLYSEDVRVGIMDGLPGLERLFKEEFVNAKTARCWAHAMRNAVEKTPKRLRDAFTLLAHKVMYADGEDSARKAFLELKVAMQRDGERAVRCLEKDLESLLVHYNFDRSLWTALRTTNAIENINRQFKRRTVSMDTLGESTLQAIVAFVALRMEITWQRIRVNSTVFNKQNEAAIIDINDKSNVVEKVIDELSQLN